MRSGRLIPVLRRAGSPGHQHRHERCRGRVTSRNSAGTTGSKRYRRSSARPCTSARWAVSILCSDPMVLHDLEAFAAFVAALRATVRRGEGVLLREQRDELAPGLVPATCGGALVGTKVRRRGGVSTHARRGRHAAPRVRGASGLPRVNVLPPRFLVPPQGTTRRRVQPARPDWLPYPLAQGVQLPPVPLPFLNASSCTFDEPSELGASSGAKRRAFSR